MKLNRIMESDEDSVIIYKFRSTRYTTRKVIGISKNEQDIFL